MPQLIKPNDVKVLTKEGEIKISLSLDLNINLNNSKAEFSVGEIQVEKKEKTIEEKTMWQIPDFKSGEKINFGK